MRTSVRVAGAIGTGALVVLTAVGCSNDSKSKESSTSATSATSSSSTSSSAAAQPTDYTALLIKGTDMVAPEVFTASAPIQNPNDKPGVATSFSNPDGTHVVGDTILILPDAATAASALEAAKGALGSNVTGGTPTPIAVGTGGTSVSGNSPDGAKSVTVVLFTEGKAFVTLEFDGPAGAAAPPDFVTDVSQKQASAIKTGLPG
ncbi:hypothetical protein FZI85_28410 [Mycobacterium sp. CBMA293]|uniref:hypothetical protein n=1 Tax=unclassified Mycolicibacterium TaxID=2636767 RepID=UPI0012DE51B2|nr:MULTISPECIES: hypothetical protein [unclassified Mycolicibacterium]MUL45646.1 hypothetical protein [Mycolicibacterium sp. CBMA 360]MUL60316.1 hypothetical protein [Mycolicibacterium sp. CBMA 335]MUL71472.1 hypothetical protein [Mycolicibacterium sp. CBMA 311]MUL73103.1 hypothetical protein [Mycolicibacterium sp. CBMA 311]MUL95922.1 hypothetical protein [Mycolicibacterium sp. CBMA 230]